MSIFVLKIFAVITMVIDHIRYVIPVLDHSITMIIGRISFPLFAFILTEGIIHTKSKKEYLKRLVVFAVLSQIPYMMFRYILGNYLLLNIIFTLAIGLMLIMLIDYYEDKRLKVIVVIFGFLFAEIVPIDYGMYGIALILVMYYLKKTKIKYGFEIGYILVNLLYYIKNYIYMKDLKTILTYFIGSMCFLIFYKLYNGKLGKKVRFLYWFYPVHLVVIYFIYLFMNDVALIR